MIHQAIKLGVHRYNIIKQKQYVHDLAWVSPESPSEFYEEVAQMPMFPTLTTLASQYQPALVVSLGFSGISIQRRWPGPGLPMVLQTSSESGKLLLHIAISGASLKDSDEGNASQWAEFWTMNLVVHLPVKKNVQIYHYITVCGFWWMVWLDD